MLINQLNFSKEKVSVLIPVYRESGLLEELITSILKDQYVNKEILVVIDEPTERSRRIAEKFRGRVRFVLNGERNGKVNALREIVKLARGEVLLFLDSDVKIKAESFLSRIVEEMKNKDEVYRFLLLSFSFAEEDPQAWQAILSVKKLFLPEKEERIREAIVTSKINKKLFLEMIEKYLRNLKKKPKLKKWQKEQIGQLKFLSSLIEDIIEEEKLEKELKELEEKEKQERLNYLEKELFKESGRREFINRYVTPILIGLFSTVGTLVIQEVIRWIL